MKCAEVAELVDAHGLGPCRAICGGSSPLFGTKIKRLYVRGVSFYSGLHICVIIDIFTIGCYNDGSLFNTEWLFNVSVQFFSGGKSGNKNVRIRFVRSNCDGTLIWFAHNCFSSTYWESCDSNAHCCAYWSGYWGNCRDFKDLNSSHWPPF